MSAERRRDTNRGIWLASRAGGLLVCALFAEGAIGAVMELLGDPFWTAPLYAQLFISLLFLLLLFGAAVVALNLLEEARARLSVA